MTRARRDSVHPDQPGFYHCISRCVRRAYLCGHDAETGRNFDHRRRWIESRIDHLSSLFCIDIYAYAIMSNHFHLVVRTDPHRAKKLTDSQVIRRWRAVYQLSPSRQPKASLSTPPPEQIEVWRQRLGDLSWFMKALNEPIARIANREDDCKGHFWESRFRSVPLLDEKAVIACMVYVDLNPVRSGEVSRVDRSRFTSIRRRLSKKRTGNSRTPTGPVFSNSRKPTQLSISSQNYTQLVDWSAQKHRHQRSKKSKPPTALRRMGAESKAWLEVTGRFEALFRTAAGSRESCKPFYDRLHRSRILDGGGRLLLYG